jgi:hypothetical protein
MKEVFSMADIKMNKVAKFNALANMIAEDATFEDGSDVREFLTHEAEVTAKRNAHKSSKPSKKQIENAELVERIKSILADSENSMTTTEISKALGGEYTPQKISALLHRADGINITKEKKVTYFSVD